MRSRLSLLPPVALVALLACENASNQPAPVVAANEPAPSAAAAVQRPKAGPACPVQPSMTVDMFLGGSCASDADCKTGKRPRCVHAHTLVGPGKPKPGPDVRACVADACVVDADCAAGELCFCGLGLHGTNVCDQSGCHDDADCGGAEGSCAADTGPPMPPTSLPQPPHVPHYCRTAKDECRVGADCKYQGCVFDRKQARFVCVQPYQP